MAHPKSILADRLNKQDFGSPTYSTTGTGPEHEQVFTSEVSARGKVLGSGSATTKRQAERLAAEAAIALLDRQDSESRSGKAGRAPARPARPGRTARNQTQAARDEEPAEEVVLQGEPEQPAAQPHSGIAYSDDGYEDDGEFEGPWPVFESILNQSLQIAQSRVPPNLTGDEARAAISAFTLDLYKELLQNLGEVVEVDEDETEA
jgi:ribonuclease-3